MTNYYFIEVSDTAKTWTEKFCIEAQEDTVVRRAKREIGWNGLRCNRKDCGQTIRLNPRGLDLVAIIERDSN